MLLVEAGILTLRHQNGDQEIKDLKQHVKNNVWAPSLWGKMAVENEMHFGELLYHWKVQ